MSQAATISFKDAPMRRPRVGRKFFIGLLLFAIALAGFFYYRQFTPFGHKQTTETAKHTAPAAAKSSKSLTLQASSLKTSSRPTAAKDGRLVKVKAAVVGFVNSVAATILPSAKAETIQQEMPAASAKQDETPLPAKRISLATTATAAAPLPVRKPQPPVPLTPEQKRLQIAQQGFDRIMDAAAGNLGAYGFTSEESLGNATLGKEIPVYTIALQGRDKFANHPVSSLLKPTDEWLYPITSGNHIYYMVKVKYDGHDYVLGTGSRALGKTYDKILAQWPADKGFHPQLIVVPNLPAYYFTIPELPQQNITDTDEMFDYHPELSPASIVLANCQ